MIRLWTRHHDWFAPLLCLAILLIFNIAEWRLK